MKKHIINNKQFAVKCLIIFTAAAVIGVTAGLMFPTAKQSTNNADVAWAEARTTATTSGITHLHDLVKDNSELQYNYTVDFWPEAQKSDNPSKWIADNLLTVISPSRTAAPDPLIAASTVVHASVVTGKDFSLPVAADSSQLQTVINKNHEAFCNDRSAWQKSTDEFSQWLQEANVSVTDLGGYATQLYMAANAASFNSSYPAVLYGEMESAGGKALVIEHPGQSVVEYRVTCGIQPITKTPWTVTDGGVYVTPQKDIRLDPVNQGNANRGGSYNWDFINNKIDWSQGDFQTEQDVARKGGTIINKDSTSGGGTSSGGGSTGGGDSGGGTSSGGGQIPGPVIPVQPKEDPGAGEEKIRI